MDLQIEGKKAIMAGVELVISARREERLRNAAQEIACRSPAIELRKAPFCTLDCHLFAPGRHGPQALL